MKRLVVLGTIAIAGPAAAATLTRGPYLQLLTNRSVTIVWNTDVAAACSLAIGELGGGNVVVTGATSTTCSIDVDGLSPGTRYGYVPRANGVGLEGVSVFRTDDHTAPFRFIVVGDTGSGGSDQLRMRDRMAVTDADFMLHTGDMIYDSGAAADFNPRFFTPYESLLRRRVFWPCLGNHDWETASGQPWRDAFRTPANNPAGSENYYSFDYGNAHVVVLDSNESTSPGSAQYTFVDRDLAASTATWNFVAFHFPLYSSGPHGSDMTIRSNLRPLFDKYHVDVVFNGHDHDYERTFSLVADARVADGTGTVYVTTGGGGQDLYTVGQSSFTAYAESVHHFVWVSVDDKILKLSMVREDGTIGDTMMLAKGALPTPTTTVPRATLPPTTTTTLPKPPPLPAGGIDLPPIADTYIEARTESTWDHGRSDHMDVDTSPFGVAYLKFDLTGVRTKVSQALLQLTVTNSSVDGGRVYPIPVTNWLEGTGSGVDAATSTGIGLKWTDVDRNGDGVLDARDGSALVPDPTRAVASLGAVRAGTTIQVDVTKAVQAGPTVYTLAIMNGSSDGATFGSREAATASMRPVLHLFTGTTPPPPPPPPPPPSGPVCGNDVVDPGEQCDGNADAACPGQCLATCLCPAQAFGCLSQPGPLITAIGTLSAKYSKMTLLAGSKVDARGLVELASPSNLYPIRLGGDAGVCFAGGRVTGQYDRSATWDDMHNMNNAAIATDSPFITIDGLRVDNVEDGIRPQNGPFTIREAHLTYIRDDCVENDHVFGGLIADSLFDGCYVGISERPSSSILSGGYSGSGQTLTVANNLIRLQPMPGPRGGAATDLGNGVFFKWSDSATKLDLHDNIFMAEKVAQNPSEMGIPTASLTNCANNVLVWLGPGNYPVSLPSCVTVTRDRGVWDRAVAAWKTAHPGVAP